MNVHCVVGALLAVLIVTEQAIALDGKALRREAYQYAVRPCLQLGYEKLEQSFGVSEGVVTFDDFLRWEGVRREVKGLLDDVIAIMVEEEMINTQTKRFEVYEAFAEVCVMIAIGAIGKEELEILR